MQNQRNLARITRELRAVVLQLARDAAVGGNHEQAALLFASQGISYIITPRYNQEGN